MVRVCMSTTISRGEVPVVTTKHLHVPPCTKTTQCHSKTTPHMYSRPHSHCEAYCTSVVWPLSDTVLFWCMVVRVGVWWWLLGARPGRWWCSNTLYHAQPAIYDLSIVVSFGHNELWQPKAANSVSVSSQLLRPSATTNCGGQRPQIRY